MTKKNIMIEPDDDREAYFADARSWGVDRAADAARSRRIAWIVASIAVAIAALEALALIALAPIKTVVPYTVMVDRTTGFVQVLEGTHPATVKPNTALTNSMLAQYVIARESFEINSLAEQYKKVALWSGGEARRDYLALMPASNVLSPLNVYPRAALVNTMIEGVTPSGPDSAQVRFRTERRDPGQGAVATGRYIAQIRYRYSGEPLSLDDRLANPLGFQVIEYSKDQELAPQPMPAVAPVAAPVNLSPAAAPMRPVGGN